MMMSPTIVFLLGFIAVVFGVTGVYTLERAVARLVGHVRRTRATTALADPS